MVPDCDGVRNGMLTVGSNQYLLPRHDGPHALHGTILHEISLSDESLTLSLTVSAHQPMPAQVGWHPWFHPPESYTMPFASMLEKDAQGIAVSLQQSFNNSLRGTFDDCFIAANAPITLHYPEVDLELNVTKVCVLSSSRAHPLP